MPALLTFADYPAIRALLGTDLGTSDLADAIIALPVFFAAGMNDVLLRDPAAESRTGVSLVAAQNAARYFVAARLAGAFRHTLEEATRNWREKWPEWDGELRAANLRALALAALDEYLEPVTAAPAFAAFAFPRPGRC